MTAPKPSPPRDGEDVREHPPRERAAPGGEPSAPRPSGWPRPTRWRTITDPPRV